MRVLWCLENTCFPLAVFFRLEIGELQKYRMKKEIDTNNTNTAITMYDHIDVGKDLVEWENGRIVLEEFLDIMGASVEAFLPGL